MKKVIFYSKKMYSIYIKTQYSSKYILDYFDIEAQKALIFWGLSFKMNPILFINRPPSVGEVYTFFDIDKFVCSVSSPSSYTGIVGVVYECGEFPKASEKDWI